MCKMLRMVRPESLKGIEGHAAPPLRSSRSSLRPSSDPDNPKTCSPPNTSVCTRTSVPVFVLKKEESLKVKLAAAPPPLTVVLSDAKMLQDLHLVHSSR